MRHEATALARHVAAEIEVLREALAAAGSQEVAALGVLWVDSDPLIVCRAYAAGYERIEELADAWPDGPEGLWFPEDWHAALGLMDERPRTRQRSAAAARRELRAAGVEVNDILGTVLQTIARTINEDPSVLQVPTASTFFAFATHHDVDERLFAVIRRDASPTAVRWLEDRDVFRFPDPYP